MKKRVRKSAPRESKSRAKPRPEAEGTLEPFSAARPHGLVVKPAEFERLRQALKEAQETLDAIRSGEVDAVVVSGANGNQVYSLAGAEQPYRIYVERMQEGAVTVSSAALILYGNQRFAGMLGVPLERVISADLRDFLPKTAWELLLTVFTSGDEPVKHESQLTRPNGAPLPVMLTASRLPMDGQELMCLVVTDLTTQKEHAQLQLAKEVAEKANLAKDAFLAALSHELRTPLNPALLRAIALEQDPTVPERLRDDIALIRRNIELEARLIDDLLDLTRIAQGKMQLQLVPMDLQSAVRRAVEICEADIRAKDLDFHLSLTADESRTQGDPVRVQQAVWNLLNNAAKFTPRGGRISVTSRNPRPGILEVQVSDTGIGFSRKAGGKLFVAFEQGGNDVTRQFGGLGLGLAITRSIIAAHGGTVEATSPGKGQGAVFTLGFPLRPAEGSPEAAPGEALAPAGASSRIRILLVEDHRDTRTTMEFLLKRSAFEVRSAETATEALALANRHAFDLVITDLGLPDRSGIELMRELRAKHQLRGIATSGYGMEEDIAECLEAGFDYHLTKPIKLDQLRRLVIELASTRKQP